MVLLVFNLIPAFPMDGGRVLRAVLAIWLGYGPATQVAARIGQGLALVFAALGFIMGNPMLVLIALFIFAAAGGEARYVKARETARRTTRRQCDGRVGPVGRCAAARPVRGRRRPAVTSGPGSATAR